MSWRSTMWSPTTFFGQEINNKYQTQHLTGIYLVDEESFTSALLAATSWLCVILISLRPWARSLLETIIHQNFTHKPVLKVTSQPGDRAGAFQHCTGCLCQPRYAPPYPPTTPPPFTSMCNATLFLPRILISALADDGASVKMILQENKEEAKHHDEGCCLQIGRIVRIEVSDFETEICFLFTWWWSLKRGLSIVSSSPLNHFKRLLTRGSRLITAGAMAGSLTDFLGQIWVWEKCGPPSSLASASQISS